MRCKNVKEVSFPPSDTPEGVDLKLIKTRKSWDSAYLDRMERL